MTHHTTENCVKVKNISEIATEYVLCFHITLFYILLYCVGQHIFVYTGRTGRCRDNIGDAGSVVAGGTGGCRPDNLRCYQWRHVWRRGGSFFFSGLFYWLISVRLWSDKQRNWGPGDAVITLVMPALLWLVAPGVAHSRLHQYLITNTKQRLHKSS